MKKVLLSIVIVMALFVLTGCNKNELKGIWKNPKDDALNTVWTFKAKDKCEMKNDYFSRKGTYKIDGNKVTIKIEGWANSKVFSFKIKNNKLTLQSLDDTNPSYIDMEKSK